MKAVQFLKAQKDYVCVFAIDSKNIASSEWLKDILPLKRNNELNMDGIQYFFSDVEENIFLFYTHTCSLWKSAICLIIRLNNEK